MLSKISTPALDAGLIPIGVSQTWQNMTASRAKGTEYQNTTGKPIVVSAVCQGQFTDNFKISVSTSSGSGYVEVGRVDCGDYYSASANVPHNACLQAIVPTGHYYKLEDQSGGSVTLVYWAELRG